MAEPLPNIPYHFAKLNDVFVEQNEEEVLVYHLEDTPMYVFSELQRVLKTPFSLKLVSKEDFQRQMAKVYQAQSSVQAAAEGMTEEMNLDALAEQLPSSEDLLDSQDDAPIIRLLNALFTQAIKQQASDIHIETYENRVIVRNRIDGVLQEVLEINRSIAPLVISRVKVMAKLDIAEKRIPQDGRIALQIGGHGTTPRYFFGDWAHRIR